MKFVDDNLLGTSPVRSAKSGSKSAGKPNNLDAANQQSAFQNAFADAGKKKQPVISISAKPVAETGAQVQKTASADLKIAEPTDDANVRLMGDGVDDDSIDTRVADAPGTGTAHLPISPSEINVAPKSAVEITADPDLRIPAKKATDIEPDISVAGDEVIQQKITPEKAEVVDVPIGEKAADGFKDHKAQMPKLADVTDRADAPAQSAEIPAGDAPADVSQLLTLLGAAQRPVATTTTVQVETTPAMSEFQDLAERAGKAKAAPKDAQAGKADIRAAGDTGAAENATKAGSDQVFRFARADGKGQPVSMTVGSDGDKAAAKNDAPATQAKAETVTVLEARRYLGLAPASNAAAVTSQIASNPEWARALQPGSAAEGPLTQAATGKVLDTLKIQMHPIDLGTVTATLRLKDDELSVEIKVETGEAFRQLSDDQGAMVKALRAQGFAVDQVNIIFNASDSSGGGSSQQAQPQTGQQGREAAGDGQAKGQRNDNDGSRGQGRERWMGNEGTGDASSGAELNRAGDIYM